MTDRLATWLAARTPGERAVLGAVGLAVLFGGGLAAVLAVRTDLARLAAAVSVRERELSAVRRLAAELGPTPTTPQSSGPSLVTRLETAAGAVVGRQRIAAMTPTATPLPEGLREERVTLRLAGTSLAEVVRLLHGLGSADPPIEIARLELRKHPDDVRRFDASLEAARVVAAGEP